MSLDSGREGDNTDSSGSNEINRDYHKNEMGSDSKALSEKYNASSLMDSENNSLELNYSLMSRTDLEIHANMVVFVKNCEIIREIGRHAEVAPFVPGYESLHKVTTMDDSI